MTHLLYGLNADITLNKLIDILSWILVTATINLLMGVYISGKKQSKNYFYLIRYGTYKYYWRNVYRHVVLVGILFVIGLFGVVLFVEKIVSNKNYEEYQVNNLITAFLLHLLYVLFISSIQMLLINCRLGERVSFLAIEMLEIVSVYFGVVSTHAACFFPGSIRMLSRSNIMIPWGFSVGISISIECICCFLIFFFGERVMKK